MEGYKSVIQQEIKSPSITTLSLVFLVVVVVIGRKVFQARRQQALPPGPPRLPVIGNLHNAPKENEFLQWHSWSKALGPVISMDFAGQPLVILNNAQSAHELLNKRAANYSGRPRSVMSELMTKAPEGESTRFILLRPYDATFRLHKRVLSAVEGTTVEHRYHKLQELESIQFMRDLLSDVKSGVAIDDKRMLLHLQRVQASLLLGLSYGYRIPTTDDPVMKRTLEIHTELNDMVTATHLVDIVPALKSLPSWLSPWKRAAHKFFDIEADLHVRNFEAAKSAPGWNMAKKILASSAAEGMSEFDVAYALGGNSEGGLETTPRGLMWLFIAALAAKGQETDFVKRAQESLDAVVGRERFPTFADRSKLPYIDAIMLELLRWRPVAPTGVPHTAEGEDTYDGFRIPAGSFVIANSWAIARDESVFGEKVEDFVPERWLKFDQVNERGRNWSKASIRRELPTPAFGYGRRVCIGRHVAEDGIWIQVARLLWAFNIEKMSKELPVDTMEMRTHGFTINPGPFKMILTPRDSLVQDVISREWDMADKDIPTVLGGMDNE